MNAPTHFTIRNELLSVGKKLVLLEDGKEIYTVCKFNDFVFEIYFGLRRLNMMFLI